MPDEGGRAVGARTVRITPFGRGHRQVPGVGRDGGKGFVVLVRSHGRMPARSSDVLRA